MIPGRDDPLEKGIHTLPIPVFWTREYHGLYRDFHFQFHRCFDTSSKVETDSPPLEFGFQDSLVINRVWWKWCYVTCEASSVQFSHSVMSDSL